MLSHRYREGNFQPVGALCPVLADHVSLRHSDEAIGVYHEVPNGTLARESLTSSTTCRNIGRDLDEINHQVNEIGKI